VACGHTDNADANAAREISRRAAVNRPNVAGVDVSDAHSVAKRSLVTSCLL
jgi:transposase